MQSTEIYRNKLKNACGAEFELISDYINPKTNVKVKHKTCGREFNIRPYNLLVRKYCPICNKEKTNKKRTKTQEQFEFELNQVWGDEYTVIGNYINSNEKIKVRHNRCGKEYFVVPYSILKGYGCRVCSLINSGEKQRKSHDNYVDDVRKAYGNEYTILTQYTTGNNKIKVKHNICGNEYYQRAQAMLTGKGCPYCSTKKISEKRRMTLEEYTQRVKEETNGEYTVLGDYITANTHILMRHDICKYEWEVTPGHFLDGTRCPKCKKVITPTTEEIKEKIYNLVGNEYELVGEVEKVSDKVTMHHNRCNNDYKVMLGDFYRGNRCPYCSCSKGEKKINEYLKSKNIKYKREYRFKDCKYRYTLPFDFVVVQNRNIKSIIEYDGIQHFKIMIILVKKILN